MAGTAPIAPGGGTAAPGDVYAQSVRCLDIEEIVQQLAAGGAEEGSITLPLCTELVDAWVLITEPGICSALRFMIDTEHQLVEGRPRWPSRQA